MTSDSSSKVVLGVITSAHGIRGAVKVKSFTGLPEDLTAYGPLTNKNGEEVSLRVVGRSKDLLLCEIDGVRYRDQAEALKRTELFVNRDQLPDADEGEYYIEDLVGLNVRLEDGSAYGYVKAVANYGASDIIDIALEGHKQTLSVAFTDENFPQIDIENNVITFVPPEIIQAKNE